MSLFTTFCSASPRVYRLVATSSRSFVTATTSTGAERTVPPIQGKLRSAEAFLQAIGRSSETKVSASSWQQFWNLSGQDMREAGVAVKDRRYILWCMEKYRQGLPLQQFAHEPSPKKTVRGWGPKVQDGKRIRSKRIKDKTKKNL